MIILFFLNATQLGLITLPKAFEVILKNLQKLEINILRFEGTLINISVALKLAQNFFDFLKCITNGLRNTSHGFEVILQILQKIEFSQMLYKWPLQLFPRLL